MFSSDDDDDVLVIDRPTRDSVSSASASSTASHSSSTSSCSGSSFSPPAPSSEASSDSDTSFGLTDTSEHLFPSYAALRTWMRDYCTSNGFEVRWNTTGGESSAHHGGNIRCWCYEQPPISVKEEIIPSTKPLRTVHIKTSSHGGKQIKCGCPWSVSFFRRASGDYAITTRKLKHSGHAVLSPSTLTEHIDSMRNIPTGVEEAVKLMIRSGMHGIESERRYLQELHKVKIDRDVFHNLVKRTKRELGIIDSSEDFKGLLYWLQSQMANRAAIARMRVTEDDCCVEAVFYMSADMIHNLNRNGEVLVMDTTFKTNRFHWPLLLVCGVNEHFQTILLAVAILHHQTTDSFTWVLEHMKSSVNAETWDNIASVVTDGDAAMAAAISAVLPHTHHLRCRYHLETNLRTNLIEKLGLIRLEEFITMWKDVIAEETEVGFATAKANLHRLFPAACTYLERNHWSNERQFAECYLMGITTLGVRSTQRVESWNALLKGMLGINSATSLSVLFQALQFSASEVDRRAVKHAAEEAARRPQPLYHRSFDQEIHPHLTHYAATKVKHQFDLQHNYQHEPKALAGADTVWYVWDARPMEERPEAKREVRAKEDFMECTCGFPKTHLLPCRHVLAINLRLYRAAFQRRQVGQRWLKYYKPPPATPLDISEPPLSPLPLPSAVPNFNPALVQAGTLPARNARYGQLMGYCTTICTRAAEYKDIFHTALNKVETLSKWVEAATSATGLATVPSSAPSAASPPALTDLHPSVGIEQLSLPEHRKKQKGRVGQRRQLGAAEKEDGKKAKLTASQLC
jgi:MULE transposase domain